MSVILVSGSYSLVHFALLNYTKFPLLFSRIPCPAAQGGANSTKGEFFYTADAQSAMDSRTVFEEQVFASGLSIAQLFGFVKRKRNICAT